MVRECEGMHIGECVHVCVFISQCVCMCECEECLWCVRECAWVSVYMCGHS